MVDTLKGAGGGGGGSSDFVQKPDTLRSNDVFEGLLGLCVGPIKGPVDGLKSIRVNGTPILDASGENNFGANFAAMFADGDPMKFPQKATLKLGSAGAPEIINVQIRNTNSGLSTPGDWLSRTLTNTGAEAIDLRFVVSQLYHQKSDGIFGDTIDLEIQMKPVGTTTWINPLTNQGALPPAIGTKSLIGMAIFYSATHISGSSYTTLRITGKTTSPYVKELRIQVPNTGDYANKGWDVRIRMLQRETYDADPEFEKRTINWESMTAVYTSVLGEHEDWRGLSWLQIYGEASDNFTGVPEVDGEYFCKIVSVPPSTVYNPDTRQYTGTTWNGSWAKAYTNDPAWVINDVITDSLSGMAAFVPAAALNKWDALELSQWCSELVDDGNGGLHPRFSMNLFVDSAQKTDEFIRYLAGACSATAWDNGNGDWRVAIDRPQNPVAVFTQENIEGEFIYSHSDIDTRFNDVTVVFINEEFDYRQDRVRITDEDHIAKFGRKPTKVIGVGVTNYQQALRWAVLRLRTNITETRAVSFTTNRQGKLLERFNWILVADSSLNADGTTANQLTTGRIIENRGGSVVVRDPVRLEVGVSYDLHATVPNPNYNPEPVDGNLHEDHALPTITVSRSVMNTAAQRGEEVTELFLSSPLPDDVAENANVALEAVGLPAIPKAYRIVDLDYAEDNERVTINAMEIDTAKWAASDRGDYSYEFPRQDPGAGGGYSGSVPSPVDPTGGMLSLVENVTSAAVQQTLVANWVRPDAAFIDHYRVMYRKNGGTWQLAGTTKDVTFEFDEPGPGIHDVYVSTVDTQGRISLPLKDTYVIGLDPAWAPVGYLTNEMHTVACDASGNGFDLSEAGGQFVLFSPAGQIDHDVAFSVLSAVGATATIDASGNYVITGLTADTATITFRAVWFGYTVDKVYTITKSKAGADGTPAKLLVVISNRQTIFYNGAGAPNPASQTITFQAQKQSTTATVNWSVTDINGVVRSPPTSFLSSSAGDTVTMTEAQFSSARNGTTGVIVTGTLTDGSVTVTDRISVVRVQEGTDGTNGVAITVNPPAHIVACDAAGTPKAGQFNKTSQITVMNGQTNVSSSASYGTPTFTGCTGTVSSGGLITITGVSATTATVSVPVFYGGASQTIVVSLTKALDGSNGTPGSGGSSGAFDFGGSNLTNGLYPIAVTSGTLYFVNVFISVSLGAGSSASATLSVIDDVGATVATLGTVSCSSSSPFNSTTINTSFASGIASGVWKQWKLKLKCTAGGVGADSEGDTNGVFHQ